MRKNFLFIEKSLLWNAEVVRNYIMQCFIGYAKYFGPNPKGNGKPIEDFLSRGETWLDLDSWSVAKNSKRHFQTIGDKHGLITSQYYGIMANFVDCGNDNSVFML